MNYICLFPLCNIVESVIHNVSSYVTHNFFMQYNNNFFMQYNIISALIQTWKA